MFIKNPICHTFIKSIINFPRKITFATTTLKTENPPHQMSSPKTPLNSINPSKQQGYAYGHYFPKNWSQEYIKKILDPSSKNIQLLSIIRTKVGEPSGKIMIKFVDEKIRKKFIEKYNEDFLISEYQTNKIVILPFELKTLQNKRQAKQDLHLKNGVRLSNLDYDISEQQLRKLAADYGKVTHIDMNLRQSGINKGFATMYFQKNSQAIDFIAFLNGFVYKDNKLKAHLMNKREKVEQRELLAIPIFTFNANIQLMKRIQQKQSQNIT